MTRIQSFDEFVNERGPRGCTGCYDYDADCTCGANRLGPTGNTGAWSKKDIKQLEAAIENPTKVLMLDPRAREAAEAIERLTDVPYNTVMAIAKRYKRDPKAFKNELFGVAGIFG